MSNEEAVTDVAAVCYLVAETESVRKAVREQTEFLINRLEASDPAVRAYAAGALGALAADSPDTIDSIRDDFESLLTDNHPDVRVEAAWALSQLATPVNLPDAAMDALIGYLTEPSQQDLLGGYTERRRQHAIAALGETASMRAARALREQATADDEPLSERIVDARDRVVSRLSEPERRQIPPTVSEADQLATETDNSTFDLDTVAETALIPRAIAAAETADSDLYPRGIKALKCIFQDGDDGSTPDRQKFVGALDSTPVGPDSDESLRDAIVRVASANLHADRNGETRGWAALIIAYIAQAQPGAIPVQEVDDDLIDILENESVPARKRRATAALTHLGYYDAPERQYVRQRMANSIDVIRKLSTDPNNLLTKSVALRALGFTALSHPDAVLPATELTDAVTDDSLRPRNRARAVRALWQVALADPEVATPHLDSIIDLLTYTVEDATETEYRDQDERSLDAHCRWIRSNAAKTIAAVGAEMPSAADSRAIDVLIERIELDDLASYRAILALGEVSDEYAEEIISADGHNVLQSALTAWGGQDIDEVASKSVKKFGYASWALLKIAGNTAFDWTPDHRIVDLVMAVPHTEKTQFRRRRIEALALLAARDPELLDTDRIRGELDAWEAEVKTDPERDWIATIQERLEEYNTDGHSGVLPDTLRQADTHTPLEVVKAREFGPFSADLYEATVETDGSRRKVMLKIIRAGADPEGETATRFVQTVRLWERISDHSNVVEVVAWGPQKRPWIAMEKLDYTLADRLEYENISTDEALWIAERLAYALAEAHAESIVHFDIKPSNILFEQLPENRRDRPKLSDWQLARYDIEDIGTMDQYDGQYAAPEQRSGSEFGAVGHRADLYQLGEVLYELLAGHHPFPERNGGTVVNDLRTPPQPIGAQCPDRDIPPVIDELLSRLMRPYPNRRNIEAADIRETLRAVRHGNAHSRIQQVPTSETGNYPPLMEVDMVKAKRNQTVAACLRQARTLRHEVSQATFESNEYQELLNRLDDLIDELRDLRDGMGNKPVPENSFIYTEIEDIEGLIETVYNVDSKR